METPQIILARVLRMSLVDFKLAIAVHVAEEQTLIHAQIKIHQEHCLTLQTMLALITQEICAVLLMTPILCLETSVVYARRE